MMTEDPHRQRHLAFAPPHCVGSNALKDASGRACVESRHATRLGVRAPPLKGPIRAIMGAQIGTGVRPLVLCGDGSFQMTGPEISHAPSKGVSPIVVLINNGGWSIFRPVSPRADLLEIPSWPHAELVRSWGGTGLQAETREELRQALKDAHEAEGFALIDCRVPPDSLSPISRKYIQQSARKGRTGSRS